MMLTSFKKKAQENKGTLATIGGLSFFTAFSVMTGNAPATFSQTIATSTMTFGGAGALATIYQGGKAIINKFRPTKKAKTTETTETLSTDNQPPLSLAHTSYEEGQNDVKQVAITNLEEDETEEQKKQRLAKKKHTAEEELQYPSEDEEDEDYEYHSEEDVEYSESESEEEQSSEDEANDNVQNEIYKKDKMKL